MSNDFNNFLDKTKKLNISIGVFSFVLVNTFCFYKHKQKNSL